MTNKEYLSIYLNDHLAGSVLGLELAKRAVGNNAGTPVGETLAALEREIAEDRYSLEQLMSNLGIKRNVVKEGVAWTLEKAGRLKLNGGLLKPSPLSRLIELEGLSLGVEGKLAMWKSLKLVGSRVPELAALDLDRLIERAEFQRARLEKLRMEASLQSLLTAAPEDRVEPAVHSGGRNAQNEAGDPGHP